MSSMLSGMPPYLRRHPGVRANRCGLLCGVVQTPGGPKITDLCEGSCREELIYFPWLGTEWHITVVVTLQFVTFASIVDVRRTAGKRYTILIVSSYCGVVSAYLMANFHSITRQI